MGDLVNYVVECRGAGWTRAYTFSDPKVPPPPHRSRAELIEMAKAELMNDLSIEPRITPLTDLSGIEFAVLVER